jgi:glyoxylase-like metal-dependent hydrolase (beta-lactamase superfamily II)
VRFHSTLVTAGGALAIMWAVAGQPPAARATQEFPLPQSRAAASDVAAAERAAAPDDGLEVVHVQGSVFMIAGDGGNVAVQVGPDGVVLANAGAGQRSPAVIAAVRALTAEPIRFILNTDSHADHVGGNGALAAAGRELGGGGRGGGAAVIGGVRTGAARIAHENVLLHMARPVDGKARFPEATWPTESFLEKKQLYMNGEGIDMRHRPASYSNGDAIVFFRRSDVIAAGAVVDSEGFPRIDVAGGGSIAGVIDTLNLLVDIAIPPTPLAYQSGGTYIVPGWGRVMDQPDIVAYRDMVTVVRDVIASMAGKGMTLAQIKAAEPTRGFTRRFGSSTGPWTTDMFVEAVYAGVSKGGSR